MTESEAQVLAILTGNIAYKTKVYTRAPIFEKSERTESAGHCTGCVAHGNREFCHALPNCHDVIFVELKV